MNKFDIQHLDLYYGDFKALKDINLEIQEHGITAFIGPSGCGKSTLLRTLDRMNDLVEGCRIDGKILLDGKDIFAPDMDVFELRKRVGMVFQKPNPFPMSVYDNIAYGPRTHGIRSKAKLDELVERSLRGAAIWDELKDRLKKSALGLSGGQQQRLCIARALAVEPEVLLMDEPLSNLDAKLRNQMRAEIIKLRQRIDTTFIYVTHDQTEAMTLGDRIVIMKDGVIQQIGTPQEVFDHPTNLFVAGFIGTPQMNFFDAELVKEDGRYAVVLENARVELSEAKQANLARKQVQPGPITLGVRPEHISLAEDASQAVRGTVDVAEMMGSAVHLHVDACGRDIRFPPPAAPCRSPSAGTWPISSTGRPAGIWRSDPPPCRAGCTTGKLCCKRRRAFQRVSFF